VFADGGMIEQVLLNLVLNARDAQPDGGTIAIVTALRTLPVAEADLVAGEYAVLTVRDTGTGIAPEHVPRLFEPFFTTKPPGQGTGLGLATAYGIVQQHSGTIRVASHPGQGTSMEVWLPLSSEPLPPDADSAEDGMDPADAPLPDAATTVLVVEDEVTVRRLLQRVLEREGFAVYTAGSGREALDWWPRGGHAVDLVITDLVMPGGVSGTALAKALLARRPDLPIVFTSGYDPEFDPTEVTMIPGENFIPKPATREQILSVVRRRLAARPL
jgi:CheY-like chemotaxis protein